MLTDVGVVKTQLQANIASIFKHPLAWGNGHEIEAVFLTHLELLHLIDYPECRDRCGWNCHVSYSSGKYERSCSLTGCLEMDNPNAGPRKIVELLVADLKEIWDYFNTTHPVEFTFCGGKVGKPVDDQGKEAGEVS